MQSRGLIFRKKDEPASPFLAAKFRDDALDLAGRDHQPDAQTRSCYSKPIDELKINNLVYGAVLPPIGNSQKLQVKWSGFLQIMEIVNQVQVKIKEINVPNPYECTAHITNSD